MRRPGIQIVGLEREGPMLEEVTRKRAGLNENVRRCLTFHNGRYACLASLGRG